MKSPSPILQSTLAHSQFGKADSAQCLLLVEIDQDHLSFAIFNQNSQQFVALRSYAVNTPFYIHQPEILKQLLSEDDWLQYSYAAHKISFSYLPFSLVPLAHYHFNPGQEWQQVNSISTPECRLSFAVDGELQTALQQRFTNYSLYHNMSGLLSSSNASELKLTNDYLLINVHAHHIDVLAYKNQALVLCNSYPYVAAEDVIYFLTFICQQFEFSHESILLLLAGEITKQSALFLNMSKYFRNIEYVKRPMAAQFFCQELAIPQQFHYSLFSLLQAP